MEIRIVPFSAQEAGEARAFNDRLRARNENVFWLAERAPEPEPEGVPIRQSYFVAVEGNIVRGGFMLAGYPGYFGDRPASVINCRKPLSEGIIDPKYSLLALRLLKRMQQEGPYLFALGMGSAEARFPKLLRGAGWTIQPVPFFFKIIRATRFLSEIRVLQSSPARHMAARFAAATGIGALGVRIAQARSISAMRSGRAFTSEPVSAWGPWADELWEQFRLTCSFAVTRDRTTLPCLYSIGEDRRLSVYLIRQGPKAVGWVATLNTRMQMHKYFGNMQVGTILDCVASPETIKPALALATRALTAEGVDIVVSNQSHSLYVKAFRESGFLSFRSNYILAISPQFAEAVASQPGGLSRVHFTRGDSDGRFHL
jgi:hypothetical protein